MKNKKFLFMSLRISVSVILLSLLMLLMQDKLNDLLMTIRSVNIGLFLVAGSMFAVIIFIGALRLKYLFEVQQICFSYLEMLKLSLMGNFFNNFMPSTIGGDMFKLYYAKKRAKNLIEPFLSLIMDRAIGVASLTLLASLALLLKGELIKNATAKTIVLFFLLCMIALVILFFSKAVTNIVTSWTRVLRLTKLEHWLEKMFNVFAEFRKSPKFLYALGCGLNVQILMVLSTWVLAGSLGLNLPLEIFFVIVPVIQIVSILPSLNGLGIREGAFVYFFKDFVAPEYAFALSILYLGLMLFMSIVGGFIYMFYGRMNIKEAI